MSRPQSTTDGPARKFQKELNSGAVSLVLLSLFEAQRRAMYGYEIARRLESLADGALPMNQGALYPVLRSLEKQGLLSSELQPSDAGPPRKYYRLTVAGREALASWREAWNRTTSFVDSVLENSHDNGTERTSKAVPRRTRTTSQKSSGRRTGRRAE